jgi:hypothetical protein
MVADRGDTRTRGALLPVAMSLALALAACGGGAPSAASPSPLASLAAPTADAEPTAAPSALPSVGPGPTASQAALHSSPFAILPADAPATVRPEITCTGPIGASDPVAIVQLHGTATEAGPIVLRDYADLSKPRSVCTFGNVGILQLIDPRHVVIYGDGDVYAVVDLPDVRYRWLKLPAGTSGFGVDLLTISPALDQVVWRESHAQGTDTDVIHSTTASGDRILATLPDTNAGRCGSDLDSNPGAYTRSGDALFILDAPLPEISLIVVGGGNTLLSDIGSATAAPSARPLRVLWSPTSGALYYTKNGDIWRWTAATGRVRYLAGVTWTSASISPDGAHLAYVVRHTDGTSDTYLVDLAHDGAPVHLGKGHRDGAVFLNNVQLWYVPAGFHGCTGEGPQTPLIYNLVSGTEAPSLIDSVLRVWPATDSQY